MAILNANGAIAPIKKPNLANHLLSQEATIDSFAAAYTAAKEEVAHAKSLLEEAEAALIAKLGAKEEGPTTFKGSLYKIVTTGKISRTIDKEKLAEVDASIVEAVVNYKPSLTLSAWRKLDDADKLALSPAVTSKPAKTSIKIELIES